LRLNERPFAAAEILTVALNSLATPVDAQR